MGDSEEQLEARPDLVPVSPWAAIAFLLTGGRRGAWPEPKPEPEPEPPEEVEIELISTGDSVTCPYCGGDMKNRKCTVRSIARKCPGCGTMQNHWPCMECGTEHYAKRA